MVKTMLIRVKIFLIEKLELEREERLECIDDIYLVDSSETGRSLRVFGTSRVVRRGD